MIIMWISLMLISQVDCKAAHQPDRVMMVSVGENVILRCLMSADLTDAVVWYKQTAGQQLEGVVMVQKIVTKPNFFENFTNPRFSIEMNSRKCNLQISNVTLSDEAMYICGLKTYETYLAGGTYLAVKGSQHNHHEVSVVQRSESESVLSGDTVTLMCSVLSELKTDDIRMFWIRSDSENPVPEILYTQNQCESDCTRSCTFSLSRNIMKQEDIGTYYCAVVTCGKILFGNRTRINIVKPVDPLVIVLSVLLGICVIVNIAQAILSQRKEIYDHNQENRLQVMKYPASSQDGVAVELIYAVLHIDGKLRVRSETDLTIVEYICGESIRQQK